jgi:phosphoribosylglycinamide formyltransferase-1
MRILTPWLVGRWGWRMLNIHPALLPAFKGLDTHARALAAGVKIHGASVHFVVPEMDSGPIIAQGAVPVHDDDDEHALASRVLAVEHRIYPLALALVAQDRVRVVDGRCVIDGALAPASELVVPVVPQSTPVMPRAKP